MTDFRVDGTDYGWKDRQRLDPESRRTFEGIVWLLAATAGFLVVVWLVA